MELEETEFADRTLWGAANDLVSGHGRMIEPLSNTAECLMRLVVVILWPTVFIATSVATGRIGLGGIEGVTDAGVSSSRIGGKLFLFLPVVALVASSPPP
jgi:hypothetical protein